MGAAKFWQAAAIESHHSIRPTNHNTGVGTIGEMDEGSSGDDYSIDEECLFDAVFEEVVEELETQIECEEAPIRLPSYPSDPTSEERERHNKTNLPHRSWCAVCVEARAREDKHYTAVCVQTASPA